MATEKIIRHSLDDLFQEFKVKRVAVYARVSSEGELRHHSIEAQVNNLKSYVQQHLDWELVDCYVDEGVTGTKMDRPAFNLMMEDARRGKIDIILTKSVSRMARNYKALFKVLEELKDMGVTVIFDSEHISTDDPEAMFQLQMKSIAAEKTASDISKAQQWSIRNRFREGIPNTSRAYGYKIVGHEIEIIPEEADVIKRIFDMYLAGMGRQAICNVLNKEKVPTKVGGRWHHSTLYTLLQNEIYIGDLLLQKGYTTSYLTKCRAKNRGELAQYLIRGNHEAIIDKDTFDRVQAELLRRGKGHDVRKGKRHREPRLMSQLVRCGYCGSSIYYKLNRGSSERAIWICKTHIESGADQCPIKSIREDILINATRDVLTTEGLIKSSTVLTNDILKKHIRYIIAKEGYELEYHLNNGNVTTRSYKCRSRSKSWTPEMRQKARERAIAMRAKQKEARENEQ